MANNISLSDILHNRPAVVPTIYGYALPTVADHKGYIKIGYTDRENTETRIKNNCTLPQFRLKFCSKNLPCAQTVLALQIKTFTDC